LVGVRKPQHIQMKSTCVDKHALYKTYCFQRFPGQDLLYHCSTYISASWNAESYTWRAFKSALLMRLCKPICNFPSSTLMLVRHGKVNSEFCSPFKMKGQADSKALQVEPNAAKDARQQHSTQPPHCLLEEGSIPHPIGFQLPPHRQHGAHISLL